VIDPTFEPGSGWYRRGPWAPGSPMDRAGREHAARPAWVYRMRHLGRRLRAELVAEPQFGLLLAERPGPDEVWHLALLQDDLTTEIAALAYCRLVKEGVGGTRQYQGQERDAGNDRHLWQQTWLCTPTLAIGAKILDRMAEQEW
jgi:hypothetical protein